jgi:DNA-binding helix-hairpin-helix protein with protein kinase domain
MGCEVQQFLGGGGQGEVYRAALGGNSMALKWYFPHAATIEQRRALQTLVNKGAPNDKFLWPLELASADGVQGYGYVMTLREPQYKGIVDLMKGRINPSFRALAIAGRDLAHSFYQLHAHGLCYRDISFGNVFFNPDNGEVLICDNDNVTVDGSNIASVLGTPRFMAPEIVRGEALPSTRTDLFSLAVLLFYMFMIHHPLEGQKEASIRCFDLPAMTKLYGLEPVFIFDPRDDSNRPVPGYQDVVLRYWNIYPTFLKRVFTQAFTTGITDPDQRVRETVWRNTMVRLTDSIVYCSGCGSENFYDPEAMQANNGKPGRCWNCDMELRLPARIKIGRNVIMLNHDTHLYPYHLDDGQTYNFTRPVAEVSRHPTNPNIWGLKNTSSDKWVSIASDGEMRDVEPGRSVTLALGTKVNFGRTEGEIRM